MFKSSSFGLDISDESIKFVELVSTSNGIQIGKYGEHKIPVGAIESGKVKDSKSLGKILLSLKKKLGLKSARVSLPNEAVEDKEYIEDYLLALKNSQISVKSFEPQAQAICRSIMEIGDEDTYLIVDFGKKQSTVFIVSRGRVISGFTIESDKVSILRDEISKHFLHWHTRNSGEEDRSPIKKIIVCGNGSNLMVFSEYLSVNLRNKIEIANVWVNIIDTEKNIPGISFKESLTFAPALGVALRDFIEKVEKA